MKLPVYIVSDSHFRMNSTDDELARRAKLFQQFDRIKSTGGTLIIGGDYFDFWFEFRDVIPFQYCDILGELREIHKSGIDIHFVLGNHDYWDFGFFKRFFNAKVYKGDLHCKIENESVLLTHGDGILSRDFKYRLMRKIIRHPISILLFKLVHPDLGCSIARCVSKTSNKHNRDHSLSVRDTRELKAFAEKHWRSGIDTVLMGHYHLTGISNSDGHHFIQLGDWLTHFTITIRDENGWHQESV